MPPFNPDEHKDSLVSRAGKPEIVPENGPAHENVDQGSWRIDGKPLSEFATGGIFNGPVNKVGEGTLIPVLFSEGPEAVYPRQIANPVHALKEFFKAAVPEALRAPDWEKTMDEWAAYCDGTVEKRIINVSFDPATWTVKWTIAHDAGQGRAFTEEREKTFEDADEMQTLYGELSAEMFRGMHRVAPSRYAFTDPQLRDWLAAK